MVLIAHANPQEEPCKSLVSLALAASAANDLPVHRPAHVKVIEAAMCLCEKSRRRRRVPVNVGHSAVPNHG